MLKFGRYYSLSVQDQNNEFLVIGPDDMGNPSPFTIEFDITRNILSAANICQIRIYNLSATNRQRILFNKMDWGNYKAVTLRAGYLPSPLPKGYLPAPPIIFSGGITQCSSVREGVNFITTIECFDGGFAFTNGVTIDNFPPGTPDYVIYETLINSLPFVQGGAVGHFPNVSNKSTPMMGNTCNILTELLGPGGFYIDNGIGYVLGNSECLVGEIDTINSASGLLGTPVREQALLNFDMIFEPRIIVGQLINLESTTAPNATAIPNAVAAQGQPLTAPNAQSLLNYNGPYKVISVKHKGMISAAICGDAITSVGLFFGSKFLTTVQNLPAVN